MHYLSWHQTALWTTPECFLKTDEETLMHKVSDLEWHQCWQLKQDYDQICLISASELLQLLLTDNQWCAGINYQQPDFLKNITRSIYQFL